MSPTGGVPGRASGEIYISLHDYERRVGGGYAFPDNVGFIVNLPNRRSLQSRHSVLSEASCAVDYSSKALQYLLSKFAALKTTVRRPGNGEA